MCCMYLPVESFFLLPQSLARSIDIMRKEKKIRRLVLELELILKNKNNLLYRTENAAPCKLHGEMLLSLKIVHTLLQDGLDRHNVNKATVKQDEAKKLVDNITKLFPKANLIPKNVPICILFLFNCQRRIK